MDKKMYSIRMRASSGGKHLSGAERIAEISTIDRIVQTLAARALSRAPEPDEIVIRVDSLGLQTIPPLTSLDVVTMDCPDVHTGRSSAIRVLERAGIPRSVAESAVAILATGAAPSGNVMRGAVLMNAEKGERLEKDRERGVRASRFDWSDPASSEMEDKLAAIGLTHYRIREALGLATKVAHAPGVVAELCWSDDPDYTAGYVASLKTGYVRFPYLKHIGNVKGGRVIFVSNKSNYLESCVRYLQSDPVLIVKAGTCKAPVTPSEYFSQ